MSTPRTDYEDKVEGTLSELASAKTALNMEPSPLSTPRGIRLFEVDHWAEHAYEHICAAITLTDRYIQESGLAETHEACPRCSERRKDKLVWTDDEIVRCQVCGLQYAP